ncbi:MAG: protein-disulfide reductase DsbD domain-containing protein [Rhizobiaceae bacterium]
MKKLSLSITCLATFAILSPAMSASSPWFKADGAKIRLISLPSPDGRTIDAGLQIELEKGWKTYWRSPGASGIPPEISFTGSQNIASTKLQFPIPIAFGEGDNLTAGYKGSVTLPIAVEPLFSGRKVVLKVTGTLGICGEVCLPVEFTLSLTEDGKGFTSRDVSSALFNGSSNLIGKRRDDFHIESSHVVDTPLRTLAVSARVPAGTVNSTLHVEGPSDWYLTPVHAQKIEGNVAMFQIRLADIPKDAKPHATKLQFSLVADGVGIEETLVPSK